LKADQAVCVAEFTKLLKQDIELRYKNVHVLGEVSNLSKPSSGHVYFTLKDNKASLSCVMWRSTVARAGFVPQHGDLIEVKGNVTLYEPRGSYQLDVRLIKPAGVGDLEKRFQELKKKLWEEGLFDPDNKKELPFLPRRIALITSASGAARHDMERSIRSRFPPADIVMIGCHVQGMEAMPGIVSSINLAQKVPGVDVVVCGRGGGSLEDLWAFNEEAVVRAIAGCRLPIISAVGHEVDVTLADFAADVRALTPTGVGELVVPEWFALEDMLVEEKGRLARGLKKSLDQSRWRLTLIEQSSAWQRPQMLVHENGQYLDDLLGQIKDNVSATINDFSTDLRSLEGQLKALSPLAILQRGYSVTTDENGNVLKMNKVEKDQNIQVRLQGGTLKAHVVEVKGG